ncbi:hypothetical protein [Kitasatospora sp. NPDC050543]|uniref:hypothetical protein n=1 Tax=Kitasatospora sp. NPDC050543 TaxID=3364054 RepID=UPI003797F73A
MLIADGTVNGTGWPPSSGRRRHDAICPARPSRGAGTMLTGAGAASVGVFALVGTLSGLSMPWPLALTAALFVVLAQSCSLSSRARARAATGPRSQTNRWSAPS